MEFECGSSESEANRHKHGIDFDEARVLRDDPNLAEVPARTTDEPGILIVSRIADRHRSAIVAPRGGKIRIISVRRSRPEKVAIHEGT